MPRIKETLNTIKDILTVLSVLIALGSVVASAIAWVAVNVFYPESMAIEVTKYLSLVLISVTISTILLQAHKKKLERNMETIKKETDKIVDLNILSDRLQRVHDNLQYLNSLFAIECRNCKQGINIPIPCEMVKDIHLVDGPPTGRLGAGRELQIVCQACGQVFHIIYP